MLYFARASHRDTVDIDEIQPEEENRSSDDDDYSDLPSEEKRGLPSYGMVCEGRFRE